jgi:hypothetical protein
LTTIPIAFPIAFDPAPWLVSRRDRGISRAANRIRERLGELSLDVITGVGLAALQRSVYNALFETFAEAHLSDWDGPGTRAVAPLSVANAVEFVNLLPTAIPAPHVGADSIGRIHFEWRTSPDRVFVVSVGPTDDIHYAGVFGRSTTHGTEELRDELPEPILANLGRVLRTSPR